MTASGWVLLGWYVFSAVVSGMPAPAQASGPGYRWAYATLHLLAGNLATAVQGVQGARRI